MVTPKQREEKLEFFKGLLRNAESYSSEQYGRMEKWKNQYEGNDKDYFDEATANQLPSMRRKMTYELIEASKSLTVPAPRVDAECYTPGRDRAAKKAERLLATLRRKLHFDALNDADEMYSSVYGTSVWLMEWDESVVTHDTVGEVKISVIQPEDFFPQPGARKVDECEYLFLRFRSSPDEVKRRYDVDVEAGEGDADADPDTADETVWVYVCYYRDDNDSICQFVWTGDFILLDLVDYYARKVKICRKCGKAESLCQCEKPDLEVQEDEYEELTEDIERADGSVIPAMSPVYRDGEIVMEEVDEIVEDPVTGEVMMNMMVDPPIPLTQRVKAPKMAPTRIRYYKPRSFPVRVHTNVSMPDAFWGGSDCEAIRDEQQEVNKLLSRIHEKVMRATVIGLLPEDVKVISNTILGQYVQMPKGVDRGAFGSIDTTPDFSRDLLLVQHYYDQAMQTLGITPSYLGQADSTAQSGKAKQIQVQQASGRLQIKRALKNATYAEIDRATIELHLAYDDDKRPISYVDEFGSPKSDDFSRYDYCVMDPVTMEWYVDDRYIFSTDTGGGVEQQRETMWELNQQNYSNGLFGVVGLPETLLRFWLAQEKAHYPDAHDNVEYFRALVVANQQMQQQQAMMAAMVPQQQQTGGATNG